MWSLFDPALEDVVILKSGHMGKTKVKSTRTSSFRSHKYQLFIFFHLTNAFSMWRFGDFWRVHLVKAMVFPVSSHVWMWELDYKESWVPRNWCFWIVVLENTLESPLDSKEIQPVHPKGNQSWIFIGRTDADAEIPVLWPPDAKNWLLGKDPDAGKDWRWEKGMTEVEMVWWHYWLDGHEFQ